jgi:hypothetical protein
LKLHRDGDYVARLAGREATKIGDDHRRQEAREVFVVGREWRLRVLSLHRSAAEPKRRPCQNSQRAMVRLQVVDKKSCGTGGRWPRAASSSCSADAFCRDTAVIRRAERSTPIEQPRDPKRERSWQGRCLEAGRRAGRFG